uniref:Uncharacterized protein n=1 Tax=Panagrolaimus davidi TaxID=227884 RepID=A0A914Q8B4_9BILA
MILRHQGKLVKLVFDLNRKASVINFHRWYSKKESLPAHVLETLGKAHKRQISAVEPPKIKPLPSPVVPREEPVSTPKLPPAPLKKPDAPIRTEEPVDVKASRIGTIMSSSTAEANELDKRMAYYMITVSY